MSRTAVIATLLLAAAAPAQSGAVRDAARPILDALLRGRDSEDGDFLIRLEGLVRGTPDLTAARVETPDPQRARIRIELRRLRDDAFVLRGASPWAELELHRDAAKTTLYLPKAGVRFEATGAVGDDHLAPAGFLRRLLGGRAAVLELGGFAALAGAATLRPADGAPGWFRVDRHLTVRRSGGEHTGLELASTREIGAGVHRLRLVLVETPGAVPAPPATARREEVPRDELERMALRALRRLVEVHAPLPGLRPDTRVTPREVAHGALRAAGDQRLVLLHGEPEQIGAAHGALLGPLVRRTVDSSLYLVGLVETVRSGRWFPAVLDDAWRRLSPHIPDRHMRELDALADAVPGLSRRELRLANVFPEYFHCSGFAVFGRATKDGTLYHGRVLDYMTLIGLQHAAVTSVVKPRRGYAFLNVGYAGFIGSVTGMNERQVSLGEMGGRGEGQWDGVPMATLMRRALEECNTLDDVQALWRDSPRTCEYFYVFADGKQRAAVGVAATPQRVEFLAPGQDHPLLGEGIADTVLLSAGSRLRLLRQRVQEGYGKIDLEAARRLMDRPVAMSSNLHNALMVPAEGVALVAHAAADRPAAVMEYQRYALRDLLGELPAQRTVQASDTIRPGPEAGEAAAAMLRRFTYDPARFTVDARPRRAGDAADWHTLVTFASPRPAAGDGTVYLEWFHANPRRVRDGVAPAVLLLHILDGRMRVARGVARLLASRGFHAFVMHLPGYGLRSQGARRPPADRFFAGAQQAVADARRARDAIAALPGVDPRDVSIQGTSLGGFVAALTAGVDGGFARAFLLLAGGDLPAMFENGARDTARLRQQMEAAGIAGDALRRLLRSIDPATLGHRLPAARTWLYSAQSDTVVPPANARALGASAGLDAAHHLWFTGDHYTCALHLPAIVEHMAARLREPR